MQNLMQSNAAALKFNFILSCLVFVETYESYVGSVRARVVLIHKLSLNTFTLCRVY